MNEVALHRGIEATDELLFTLGYAPLLKADNPFTKKGFDAIVARIAAALESAVAGLDESFAVRVLEALDVDFADLSAAEREEFLQRAELALPRPALYAKVVAPVFAAEAEALVGVSRIKALRGVRLPELDLTQDAVVQHLQDGQAFYVAAAMQQRNVRLNEQVRAIIGLALEGGWQRHRVVRELEKILDPDIIHAKQSGYLDVVASAFTGYARSYGHLTAYRDAGIERYVFDSVLDEVTSDVCRFLHGTVFDVSAGLEVLERMAGNLDSAKEGAPWVRTGRNENGDRVLFTKSFEHRREIATVLRSGVGRRDDRGEFSSVYDAARLQQLGVCVPPLHGRCRSTLVADV